MFTSSNNQNTFLGQQTTSSSGKVSIGQFSLVLPGRNNNNSSRWRRTAFGVSYSQSANFFDYIDVRGINNNPNSSLAQTYINSANSAKYSENDLINGFFPTTGRQILKKPLPMVYF